MVSIPDSPTKRQDAIENSPSTLEEAKAIIGGLRQELGSVRGELATVRQERDSAYEDLDTERDYTKDLRDQLSDMYSQVDAYVQEQIYQNTLFANPDLSSSEKLVLLTSRSVVRELRADDDTSLTNFHLHTIAQQTGLTNETVGKKLHRLDTVFNTVEYKPKKVYAGKGREGKSLFVSDTKLAILPLADQPHAIQLPDAAPRHGGPREKKVCPQCGSDKVQHTTHVGCLNCDNSPCVERKGFYGLTPMLSCPRAIPVLCERRALLTDLSPKVYSGEHSTVKQGVPFIPMHRMQGPSGTYGNHTLELAVHMVNEETIGLEQSDTDALFMLNEAVEKATPSPTDASMAQTENHAQHCTCTHTSEYHHENRVREEKG